MKESWQNWCRLCAKINWRDEDEECKMKSLDELEIINKCLSISPQPFDGTLLICNDCSSFLGKLDNFRNRCLNADKMFQELKQEAIQTEDLFLIRLKYGFDEVKIKKESTNENIVFDDKPSDAFESILEIEEPVVVKLETPNVEPEQTQKKRGQQKKATKSLKVQKVHQENKKSKKSVMNKRANPDKEDVTGKDSAEDDDEPLIKHKKPTKKNTSIKKIDKPKNTFCEICCRKFRCMFDLKIHIWSLHRKEERPFACSVCQTRCTTKTSLKMHMKIHLPDEEKLIHPCQYCDKKFSQKTNARSHMKAIHNINKKTYECAECGKTVTTKVGLRQHIASHMKRKNFKCTSCPNLFKCRHRPNDISYPCPHCDVVLKSKVTLSRHLLVHSDVKKFKCNYCGRAFRRSKGLKIHLILHTGQRPYGCPFCNKTFATGSNCRNHKKRSHPVELAALEAAGIQSRVANMPRLDQLQPK